MATMRTRSRITKFAPPPPPIPTAKGSRSASNEILTQFLEKSVHIPDLTLPASHFTETASHQHTPAYVDLRSLASGATGSIDRLLGSAKEFGAFVITGHGISIDELQSLVEEAESAKSEMVWVRSGNERTESLQRVIGIESYRGFSGNMEKVADKLDAIAELLGGVFFEDAEKTTALSLYRYNHENAMELNTHLHNNETKVKLFDHALSLHLPFEPCEIRIRSEQGLNLCFDAIPEAMVVTVGKQLEAIHFL
ncbi:hypothetical protein FNV43_RR08684 [Rhamnella rubrinervis]|uniref:Non-haem dioxygenase N-terminal domain-containing protein n=1 Tax=Rhamnella rubrinervis TaxID=2594499 RepID=A0A8K0H8N6_9ROSA|nr:hypothetical protein FNV43_RR08684 [Rhamnella rubrinervis]